MACMVIGELWIYAHVITTLVLQDLLESFSDRGDFLPKIRNDECHQFFHLPPGVDPASVAALEHNFEFLIELTATFAPEPVYPRSSQYLSGQFCWKCCCVRIIKSSGIYEFVLGSIVSGSIHQIGRQIWNLSCSNYEEGYQGPLA